MSDAKRMWDTSIVYEPRVAALTHPAFHLFTRIHLSPRCPVSGIYRQSIEAMATDAHMTSGMTKDALDECLNSDLVRWEDSYIWATFATQMYFNSSTLVVGILQQLDGFGDQWLKLWVGDNIDQLRKPTRWPSLVGKNAASVHHVILGLCAEHSLPVPLVWGVDGNGKKAKVPLSSLYHVDTVSGPYREGIDTVSIGSQYPNQLSSTLLNSPPVVFSEADAKTRATIERQRTEHQTDPLADAEWEYFQHARTPGSVVWQVLDLFNAPAVRRQPHPMTPKIQEQIAKACAAIHVLYEGKMTPTDFYKGVFEWWAQADRKTRWPKDSSNWGLFFGNRNKPAETLVFELGEKVLEWKQGTAGPSKPSDREQLVKNIENAERMGNHDFAESLRKMLAELPAEGLRAVG